MLIVTLSNLYYLETIKATHGKTQWCIKKRYNHFLKLHTAIVFSRKHSHDDPDTNDTQGKDKVCYLKYLKPIFPKIPFF